jgi:hypothetical protein
MIDIYDVLIWISEIFERNDMKSSFFVVAW